MTKIKTKKPTPTEVQIHQALNATSGLEPVFEPHYKRRRKKVKKPKVIVIAAIDKNGGIGRNNDLPWRLPNDMKLFRETTAGHPVVMGRKNWESIPEKFRPLLGRQNVVLTRTVGYSLPEETLKQDWNQFLVWLKASEDEEIYIIGGGEIYKKAIDEGIVDELLLTLVEAEVECDVHFPTIDWNEWEKEEIVLEQEPDEKHKYGFRTVRYSKA